MFPINRYFCPVYDYAGKADLSTNYVQFSFWILTALAKNCFSRNIHKLRKNTLVLADIVLKKPEVFGLFRDAQNVRAVTKGGTVLKIAQFSTRPSVFQISIKDKLSLCALTFQSLKTFLTSAGWHTDVPGQVCSIKSLTALTLCHVDLIKKDWPEYDRFTIPCLCGGLCLYTDVLVIKSRRPLQRQYLGFSNWLI